MCNSTKKKKFSNFFRRVGEKTLPKLRAAGVGVSSLGTAIGKEDEQQFAAGTGVSVDALLIFMEQDNVMLFRDPDKLTQLIQHHIGIAVCIGILGDEEAEHPDEGAEIAVRPAGLPPLQGGVRFCQRCSV